MIHWPTKINWTLPNSTMKLFGQFCQLLRDGWIVAKSSGFCTRKAKSLSMWEVRAGNEGHEPSSRVWFHWLEEALRNVSHREGHFYSDQPGIVVVEVDSNAVFVGVGFLLFPFRVDTERKVVLLLRLGRVKDKVRRFVGTTLLLEIYPSQEVVDRAFNLTIKCDLRLIS